MTSTYNTQLQQRLEAYLTDGHSQEEAGRKIGVSGAALSSYRKSKYAGNVSNIEAALEEFFRLLDEQVAHVAQQSAPRAAAEYVPTTVSEDVYATLRYCHLERGIAVVYGDAGIGKTKAAEQYIRNNPAACIYVQASPVTGNLGAFLKVLARKMRIQSTRNKLDLVLAIRDRLADTNRLLIVDEAQHLKYSTLEEIRTWGDTDPESGKPGIGIVLMGNAEVYDRMLGRQEARFAQLFSRTRLPRQYSTHDIQRKDAALLFPALVNAEKEMSLLHSICQSKWGVRGAVNVYNNSANNADISYKGLLHMARSMGVGVLGNV